MTVFTGGGFDIGQLTGAMIGVRIHDVSIPEDAAGDSLLKETIGSLARDQEPRTISSLPKIAYDVSGKTWQFAPNPFGLKSLSLSFLSDREAYSQITIDQAANLRIGLDGTYAFNPSGREDLPAAVKGTRTGADTFLLEINEIADINDITIRISFGNRHPRFFLSDNTLTGDAEIELPLVHP